MSTLESDLAALARDIGLRINQELPRILRQLLNEQAGVEGGQLHFECSLSSRHSALGDRSAAVRVASVNIPADVGTPRSRESTREIGDSSRQDLAHRTSAPPGRGAHGSPNRTFRPRLPAPPPSLSDDESRPAKRRAVGGLRIGRSDSTTDIPVDGSGTMTRRLESDARVFPQRKKRLPENPNLQPSSLDKFIAGIWESIFGGVRMNPVEVIEQWQAIEGQPRLLTETDTEIANREHSVVRGMFGRMNTLARKISQTSRTCRSLEVIVQASWVQAFDDRVSELTTIMTKEKAKKTAISEACVDFSWSEKELRNKMAIWRGYHDIKHTGGWAALVFAGTGLYRYCKYTRFTEETFQTLRSLRHRFEVAADTLHPHWRSLLAIVGASIETVYVGHPHDWVVNAPNDEAVPLATTYHRWDKNFSYKHLEESVIDEDAWGLFDPRRIFPATDPASHTCQTCSEQQSDDPRDNHCSCFPNLYGSAKAGSIPVQVYRTPEGKNNGLLACCAFERGAAIGEFVGEITAGLTNMDVMVGQTERAAYQIWQGKQGNHTRFVNHSCQPNSQFERFVWLGMQRVVLVSKGLEAGEEVTVDYSDTYWKNLDKECLCGQPKCRYKSRSRPLLTPPESA